MLHFIPFSKNLDRNRITNWNCVHFAILMGVWSQFCLIKWKREMKANLLWDILCHGSLFTHLKSIQDLICLAIPAHRFAYMGPPPSPSRQHYKCLNQVFPKSLGLSHNYDQLDHSNWKLGAFHIEIFLKASPQISFSYGNSDKCI